MEKENIEKFLLSCQELIDCKYLVAEYKLQKMLQQLAGTQEICDLVGECLEQFNRDREFSKAFIQDGHGEFMFVLPEEEYKIIALVFCTLVDIDAKKIDFIDFVKRFFGREENPFKSFIDNMIVPFRDLIAEAFGYTSNQEDSATDDKISEKQEQEDDETINQLDDEEEVDKFVYAQKIAVQILSQLEYAKQDYFVQTAMQICRAIIKTTDMKDIDIAQALVFALKDCKIKQVKFLVKELADLFN